MLKRLVDPLRLPLEYPSDLKARVCFGRATAVELSRACGYVALGTADGTLLVLDAETLAPQLRYRAHAGAVTHVSWSADARTLVTYGEDWCFCVWDLARRTVRATHQLAFSPGAVAFDPGQFSRAALLSGRDLFVVDISLETEGDNALGGLEPWASLPEDVRASDFTAAQFVHNGLAVGTNKGHLVLYGTGAERAELGSAVKLATAGVRALGYSSATRTLAVSCGDRAVRVVNVSDLSEPEIGHKFSDLGLRCQWTALAFSADGEYLYATSDTGSGKVSVWNTLTLALAQQLDGARERLTALAFCPPRTALFATGAQTGSLYVWLPPHTDTWGALLPDFEQLGGLEYRTEEEDSWDIPPPPPPPDLGKKIDIWTVREPVTEIAIAGDI